MPVVGSLTLTPDGTFTALTVTKLPVHQKKKRTHARSPRYAHEPPLRIASMLLNKYLEPGSIMQSLALFSCPKR